MRLPACIAAAAGALAIAAPASAAAPSGARVEALIGLDDLGLDSFGNRDDPRSSGLVYGLGAGYDFALGTGVAVGVDVEASDSAAGIRFVSPPDDNSFDLGLDLYAGARLTVAVAESVNLYAKGGYSSVRSRRQLINPTFPQTIETSEGGVRAGAGLQVELAGNLYVGGEYRFSTYGEFDRHQGVATLGVRF